MGPLFPLGRCLPPCSTVSKNCSIVVDEFYGRRAMTKYEWTKKQVAEATEEYPH